MMLIEVGQDPSGVRDCRRTYECECEECANCTPQIDVTFWLAVAMLLGVFCCGVVVGFAIGRFC